MAKRRQFTAEFKTRVVLELLKEEKQLGELAAEYELCPNQLRNWRKEFLENAPKVFSPEQTRKRTPGQGKSLGRRKKPINGESRSTHHRE